MAKYCKWCELGECWTHGNTAKAESSQPIKPGFLKPVPKAGATWSPRGGTNGAAGNGWEGDNSFENGSLGQTPLPQMLFQQQQQGLADPPGLGKGQSAGGLGGCAAWKGWGKGQNPLLQQPQQPSFMAATPISGIGGAPSAGGGYGDTSPVHNPGPVDLSGDWKITDDKGNILEYIFTHKAGASFFEGTLQNEMKVAGQMKGTVIGWQVSDIRCKGTLTHDGTTIANGTCWSKADGRMLGTFIGEKMASRAAPPPAAPAAPAAPAPEVNGTWKITDQKQNSFVYHFEQIAGEYSFKGRQEGGKEVTGKVSEDSIEWEVHDVCCKGELSSDATRITKGTYWKKADGKHLGFFTGEKKNKTEEDKPTCPAKHPLDECESHKDLECKECAKTIPRLVTFLACKKCRYHICPNCLSKLLVRKKNKENGGGKTPAGLTTCRAKHKLEDCKCGKDLSCKECGRNIAKETTFHACKQCRYHICHRCFADGPPEKKGDLFCPAKHVMEECKCPQDLKCKECRKTIPGETSFQACKKCRYHICVQCEQKKRQETNKWTCTSCRTENYPTWSECFGCKRPRPSGSSSGNQNKRGRSRSNDRNDGKKAQRRSPSGSIERVIQVITKADVSSANEKIERAKADATEELRKIKLAVTKEERRSKFKALLVRWHPDKNLDQQDVATAVFQFLSKGKKELNNS